MLPVRRVDPLNRNSTVGTTVRGSNPKMRKRLSDQTISRVSRSGPSCPSRQFPRLAAADASATRLRRRRRIPQDRECHSCAFPCCLSSVLLSGPAVATSDLQHLTRPGGALVFRGLLGAAAGERPERRLLDAVRPGRQRRRLRGALRRPCRECLPVARAVCQDEVAAEDPSSKPSSLPCIAGGKPLRRRDDGSAPGNDETRLKAGLVK